MWQHKDGLVFLVGHCESQDEARAWTEGQLPTSPHSQNPRGKDRSCERSKHVTLALVLVLFSWMMDLMLQGFRALAKRSAA